MEDGDQQLTRREDAEEVLRTSSDAPEARANGSEQPTGERPRNERDGELESQAHEKCRRRDEGEQPSPVRDALDVLLQDERREGCEREGSGGRRIQPSAEPGDDETCNRENGQHLRCVREVRMERSRGCPREPIRERVRHEHAHSDDRRDGEPRTVVIHGPIL